MDVTRDKDAYRTFCQGKLIPIYSDPIYLDHLLGKRNWGFVGVIEDGKWLATFVYPLQKRLFLTTVESQFGLTYTSPILYLEKSLKQVTRYSKQRKVVKLLVRHLDPYHRFSVSFFPSSQVAEDFSILGFRQRSQMTYNINLNSAKEDLFLCLESSVRGHIRKAEKNYTINYDACIEEFEQYFQSHQLRKFGKKYSRGGNLSEWCEYIKRKDLGTFAMSRDYNGNPDAFALVLWDGSTARLCVSFRTNTKLSSTSTYLLYWKLIQFAKDRGCHNFDLEGSNIPKVEQTYRSLGGTRVPVSCLTNWSPSILGKVYDILK